MSSQRVQGNDGQLVTDRTNYIKESERGNSVQERQRMTSSKSAVTKEEELA